jgi:ribonucleoside-diphosphate reductase alpha chain
MLADLKYFDDSIQPIERIPADLKRLYKTAFEIEPTWILRAAAERQKWIDQAQSTNLWLADADARTASFVYREAWERGLKTTYYLRTFNRSAIDSVHHESRFSKVAAEGQELSCSLEAVRRGKPCESCQ